MVLRLIEIVHLQRCPAPLTHQQRWRDEGEAGVLHAAVGEGGRQHQQVVLTPHVRAADGLGRSEHRLGLVQGNSETRERNINSSIKSLLLLGLKTSSTLMSKKTNTPFQELIE